MQATSSVPRPHEHSQSNTVGQLLRDWRTARGISQLDLALRAGFSSASRQLHRNRPDATQPAGASGARRVARHPAARAQSAARGGRLRAHLPPDAVRRRGDVAYPRRAAVHPRPSQAVRRRRARSLFELRHGQRRVAAARRSAGRSVVARERGQRAAHYLFHPRGSDAGSSTGTSCRGICWDERSANWA